MKLWKDIWNSGKDIAEEDFSCFNMGYVNLEGKPVARTPLTHPYTYDCHKLFKHTEYDELKEKHKEKIHSAYHDRMMQWNSAKYSEAQQELGKGDYVFRDKIGAENFLRIYKDDPSIVLLAVMEGCNQSTGYPYWYLVWYSEKKIND